MPEPACAALLAKIDEQIARTLHLIGLIPAGRLDWMPAVPHAWSVAMLLGHLLDTMAGFCAVLYAVQPERLPHFAGLRELPVNQPCGTGEAGRRIAAYRDRIREGFALLRDSDLATSVPTVFTADGESLITLLLGNLEHLVNHKHQLFTYLKLMGVDAGTADLYQLRGGL